MNINNGTKSVFFIADIHFSKTKKQESFINPMNEFCLFLEDKKMKNDSFDVVIAGDYFDTQLSVADEVYKLASEYLKKISSLADTLYIMYGTTSHDRENYEPLKPLFPKNVVFIKNKKIIELDPFGKFSKNKIKTLFLPEEYPSNWKEYYEDVLNVPDNTYDIIVGHGMIHGAVMNDIIKIDNRMLGDKGFKTDVLSKISSQTLFGHIHQQQNLSDNVRYIGSMNKTGFGDETTKGFFELIILLDSDIRCKFHELKTVLDFKTVIFDKENTDFVDLDPSITRFIVSDDIIEDDIDTLKKQGFSIKKDNDTAKQNRENKAINELKFESFSTDTPLKEMIFEVIHNDKGISKVLKEDINKEIEKHFR